MASAALPCRVRRGRSSPLWCAILLTIAFAVEARYDTIDGHRCFRNLKGMTESMFDLARAYPDLSSVADIGDSYLKREDENNDDHPLPQNGYDIYAMNITASDSPLRSSAKGKTLIVSGVHPREYAPPELTMRFAESLLGGYGFDADITSILRHTEVHIIFHVNPDSRYIAETYPTTLWRKNQNPDGNCDDDDVGVDLNRNYDFMWRDQDGASDDECGSTYHGRRPESEPETKAVVDYAKRLFPEGQRRDNPENSLDEAFGEDIMGIFLDIHSPGGYIFYPRGHEDRKTEDDDALQATARKMSYFNGYRLLAGGQPDFRYAASGDSSEYMYAALGVAAFRFELDGDFYEDCDIFEDEVLPDNLSALTYLVKNAKKPFSLAKGPDIVGLVLSDGDIRDGIQYGINVTVRASDSRLVNSIRGYPDFPETGGQGVAEVRVYLDVHPDDSQQDNMTWEMQVVNDNYEEATFELEIILPQGFSAGRHTLYVQAKDDDDYYGPATGAFFDIERRTASSPASASTSENPSISPTSTVTPSKEPSMSPTITKPSTLPTGKPSTAKPTKPPSKSPTTNPSTSPTRNPMVAPSYSPTTSKPSVSPTANPSLSPVTNAPTTNAPITAAPATDAPSKQPTRSPSLSPTTDAPTTDAPVTAAPATESPTKSPSDAPTKQPTDNPSSSPVTAAPATMAPTNAPSSSPVTDAPTDAPTTDAPTTDAPSDGPTDAPSGPPTKRPTDAPSDSPTRNPMREPTNNPTPEPTDDPTESPTESPTDKPTTPAPSGSPNEAPTTAVPTKKPTREPTRKPTKRPTEEPTPPPSDAPTFSPSNKPTGKPTREPTEPPTNLPTKGPTRKPTKKPTAQPTEFPSGSPTPKPTRAPAPGTAPPTESLAPTKSPTDRPTKQPTKTPTSSPTIAPTNLPSDSPTTAAPSRSPTKEPSKAPIVGTLPPTQSKSPTEYPTDNPTAPPTTGTPTKAGAARPPTKSPIAAEPRAPTTEEREETTTGLKIALSGIYIIEDEGEWEKKTWKFFEGVYDNDERLGIVDADVEVRITAMKAMRRTRQRRLNRRTMNGIRELQSTDSSLEVTYTQITKYRKENPDLTINEIVVLPLSTQPLRDKYVGELKELGGYEKLTEVSEISITSNSNKGVAPALSPGGVGGGLGLSAIVGIACLGGAFLILLAGFAYYRYQRDGDDDAADDPNAAPTIQSSNARPPHTHSSHRTDTSLPTYGSGSVATVDYDYSRAFGGAGAHSLSEAGGTVSLPTLGSGSAETVDYDHSRAFGGAGAHSLSEAGGTASLPTLGSGSAATVDYDHSGAFGGAGAHSLSEAGGTASLPTYGSSSIATVDYDYSGAFGGAGAHSLSEAGGTASLPTYGSGSVPTVDYDYSGAFGGADAHSLSDTGGTLGSRTRQTAAEDVVSEPMSGAPSISPPKGSGSSILSDEPTLDQAYEDVREELLDVYAPAGKLGVVIDTPDDGAPVVHAVKDTSPIAERVQVGDKLVAVDDEDVREMSAIRVSKLISQKSNNASRKLTIIRHIADNL